MKQVTTQQVILLLGLAFITGTVVVLLALFDKDVQAILTSVATISVMVLGALGWSKANSIQRDVGDVKTLSNGRIERLEQHNKDLQSTITSLAMLAQPPAQPPAEEENK